MLIAGNHDYVKRESFYRGFDWADNVVLLLSPEPECVEVPEKKTAVYGCSYDKKEILENRLDDVTAEGEDEVSSAARARRRCPPHAVESGPHGAGWDLIISRAGISISRGFWFRTKWRTQARLSRRMRRSWGRTATSAERWTSTGRGFSLCRLRRYEYEDLVLNVTEDLTQYALETKLKQELALREDGKIRKIIRLKLDGTPCRRAGIFSETAAGLRQSHLRGG